MVDTRSRVLRCLATVATGALSVLLAAAPAHASTMRPLGSASNAHIGIEVLHDSIGYHTKAHLNSVPSGNSAYGHWEFWDGLNGNHDINTQESWYVPGSTTIDQNATWGNTCAVFWIHSSTYTAWGPAVCAWSN